MRLPLEAVLTSAGPLLESPQYVQLKREVDWVCTHWACPDLHVAVFGPFNQGKSTLLNALLGQKALPLGLVRTTGAVITIHYGTTVETGVTLKDGQHFRAPGTDLLHRFTILDDQGGLPDAVEAVQVWCPHPWLANAVTFVDLPGTGDRLAQDAFIREKLLSIDLVIQVLNARQPFTLEERTHLQEWLLERGITAVVFVVNFCNGLEPDDIEKVWDRVHAIVESLPLTLPDVAKVYRVDALPALRAQLQGNAPGLQVSGLTDFAAALRQICTAMTAAKAAYRRPRVEYVARQMLHVFQTESQALCTRLQQLEGQRQQTYQTLTRQGAMYQQAFQVQLSKCRAWLSQLLVLYQADLATQLHTNQVSSWVQGTLQPCAERWCADVMAPLQQAATLNGKVRPAFLSFRFPPYPTVTFSLQPRGAPRAAYQQAVAAAYRAAAVEYLTTFKTQAWSALSDYERRAQAVFEVHEPPAGRAESRLRNAADTLVKTRVALQQVLMTRYPVPPGSFG